MKRNLIMMLAAAVMMAVSCEKNDGPKTAEVSICLQKDGAALAVEGLKSGKVDCVIIDNEPAKAYVAANEGLKILETTYADEDYAICVSKENDELKEAIDNALKELIADGSLQKIVDKYIPADN